MFARRNRDLPQKAEPDPFAAKAKDLGALREAVVDAAGVGVGFWISYLFALFYFAIATLAVTHRDLLLESPVKLPFLNVELPLKTFFILGPMVFLIVHAYVLLHLVLLASKISAFNAELQAQISWDDTRARLRRQLPSNIFVQFLVGPREVQTGTIGFLLWLMIAISLVVGPIVLLILFQLQFLPYHSESITWWHRITVVIDLVLLWFLWPPIAHVGAAHLRFSDFKRAKVRAWLLVSCVPFLLVFTIATFPGERLEEKLPSVRLIPTTWQAWTLPTVQAIQAAGSGWATLHELLVAGPVNYVTGKPQSLLSNVLVLPNFEVGDRSDSDTTGGIAFYSHRLSLRGRSLEGAVLSGARLRNADFTGASLVGAHFTWADLREAKFECEVIGGEPGFFSQGHRGNDTRCAQLQRADCVFAQLQGASLIGAQLQGAMFMEAQMQGALLDDAQLQGAMLNDARLQGASLRGTQLEAAYLLDVQLQGADLSRAELQGAQLIKAQLQGANLDHAQLQGAVFIMVGVPPLDAQLDGASLRQTYVWRTYPPSTANRAFVNEPEPGPKYSGLDCPTGVCQWSEKSYAALKSLIEYSAPRDVGILSHIAALEKPPYVADDASARLWADVAARTPALAGSYSDALARTLIEIGCAGDGAPYVIGALLRRIGPHPVRLEERFAGDSSKAAQVAGAFLDGEKCPGARRLSEENKTKLREIRDRGLPASATPGAAAR